MSGKTIPFSARISVEDAEFISRLEFEGAHTPSEKLRGLLAETRRQQSSSEDYAQNLSQAQELFGKMKHQLLVHQQSLNYLPDVTLRVLDTLPDLLASLQTLTARSANLSTQELQVADAGILDKILHLNALLLPLAITSQQMSDKKQKTVFDLATLLHEYKQKHMEKKHE
ncbi:MAG: hypothetical protein QMB97_00690 [Pseudomonas sp.]